MAYSSYRGTTSPRDEPSHPVYSSNPLSPPRNSNRLSGGMMSSNAEQRVGLQRRFTTNALPTLSPIGQQRLQAVGEVKQQGNRYSALPPSEQKSRFYESLLAEQRRIQAFIEQIDPETRREVDQNLRHEHAVSQMIAQSEPTTPPDFGDAFPTSLSKPNRYSTTSLTSMPNASRPARSSTQFTSPPMSLTRLYSAGNANLPSHSVPGSRQHSDDEDLDELLPSFDASTQRATTNPNRNSLPVTRHDRQQASAPDLASILGPVNHAGFHFGTDNKRTSINTKTHTSPQDGKTYLQVQHTADGFPKLIRREDTEAAMTDTTVQSKQDVTQDRQGNARNRISLPPTALRTNDANIAGISGVLNGSNDTVNRRSIEVRPALRTTPPRSLVNGNIPAPYSTNDVPTLKSMSIASPIKHNAELEQYKLTRVNSGTYSIMAQQNQDVTDSDTTSISTPASNLHASATPFGPSGAATPAETEMTSPMSSQYAQPAFFNAYANMHMLNNGFANMNLNGHQQHMPWQPQFPANTYNNYAAYPTNGQAVAGASRYNNDAPRAHARQRTDDGTLAAIHNLKINDLKGQVFDLCIDQHGCRFLQRKLDDRDPHTTDVIFEEVRPKIFQLMIDPFGNYLCQKLLEYCTDAQRTELIKGTTDRMAEIALNQHGTRALQKMIEFIVTPEQTDLIIDALRYKVVLLIQDLNGNHVIQKCLNHLKSASAQFIFDAVGANCVTVGTHRHGCCVLQRCIDHATGLQKGALIAQITAHAMTLIQDPFGNYVIQYILDISEPAFTEPLCQAFLGNIGLLSTQKFSSNVIEKCIRCAGKETKDAIVQEISAPTQLESMLRDSYANYVVQTAIDYASDDVKPGFINNIRPLLTALRHTPYGRRIQSKINDWDGQIVGAASGAERHNAGMTATSPQGLLAAYGAYGPTNGQRANRMGFVGPPAAWNLNGTAMTTSMPTDGISIPMNGYIMNPTVANFHGPPMTSARGNDEYRFF